MSISNTEKTTGVPDFPGQREDEKVVAVIKEHWFILIWPITKGILFILMAIVPLFFGKIAFYIFNNAIFALILLVWIVIWISYIAYEYINWHRDRFIITNQRIINVDQKSLFKRRVAEVELDRIQDLSHEISGVAATAFNFGSVIVQSAGSENIEIRRVANPAELQNLLMKLIKEASDEPPVTAAELIDFIKKNRNLSK